MAVKTVAILSPGEMGAAVGNVLRESGLEVLTCLKGRSEATRRRAIQSEFATVSDYEDLARRSDLILSILVPAEATDVAKTVAEAIKASGAFEKAIYLEEIDLSAVLDVANKAAYTPPA